jgi:hypothetical protein
LSNSYQIKSREMLFGQLVNWDTYALLYLLVLFALFDRVRLNSLWGPTIYMGKPAFNFDSLVSTHVSTFARS